LVLASIIGFQTLFSFLVRKFNWFKNVFTNKPQLIMWKGEILHDKLKICNVGLDDLRAKLREANVHNYDEVKAVIFESTGDVSVIHNSSQKNISEELLSDVDKRKA